MENPEPYQNTFPNLIKKGPEFVEGQELIQERLLSLSKDNYEPYQKNVSELYKERSLSLSKGRIFSKGQFPNPIKIRFRTL